MEEILKGISDFVEECLGPLGGGEGYGWPDWFRDFAIQALATLLLFLVVVSSQGERAILAHFLSVTQTGLLRGLVRIRILCGW